MGWPDGGMTLRIPPRNHVDYLEAELRAWGIRPSPNAVGQSRSTKYANGTRAGGIHPRYDERMGATTGATENLVGGWEICARLI